MKASFSIIVLALMSTAALCQDLPQNPTPQFDRTEKIMLTVNIASRSLDAFSTRYMLTAPCKCNHEKFLPDVISKHTISMAAFEGSMIGIDYYTVHYLNQHNHRKLAKIWLITDSVIVTPYAIHNLFLKHNK